MSKEIEINSLANRFDYSALEMHNWEHIAEMYKKMDWQWAFVGVPSAKQLKDEATRLLEYCLRSNHRSIATGGICVSKYDDHVTISIGWTESSSLVPFQDILMDEALK